jgi:hypothetical protein
MEQAKPEHEFGVFRRSAEVMGISVLDQVIDKRKVDHLLRKINQVVDGHNAVVQVATIK